MERRTDMRKESNSESAKEAGAIAEILYDAIHRLERLSAKVEVEEDVIYDLKHVKNYVLDLKERI